MYRAAVLLPTRSCRVSAVERADDARSVGRSCRVSAVGADGRTAHGPVGRSVVQGFGRERVHRHSERNPARPTDRPCAVRPPHRGQGPGLGNVLSLRVPMNEHVHEITTEANQCVVSVGFC